MIGIGLSLVRESSIVILHQYFKKRKPLVEMLLSCSTGSIYSRLKGQSHKTLKEFYGFIENFQVGVRIT
jgi:hypothetical protein